MQCLNIKYAMMHIYLFFLRQQKLCSKWPNLWCVLNVDTVIGFRAPCQQAQWCFQWSRFGGHESMVLEGNGSLGPLWNLAYQMQTLCLHGKYGTELYAMLEGRKNKGERENTSQISHFTLIIIFLFLASCWTFGGKTLKMKFVCRFSTSYFI